MTGKPPARDIVLLAMYAEHLREEGDFARVTASALQMDKRPFRWALICLQAEGLIDGLDDRPTMEARSELRLTRAGLEALEARLSLRGLGHTERCVRLSARLLELGLKTPRDRLEEGLC